MRDLNHKYNCYCHCNYIQGANWHGEGGGVSVMGHSHTMNISWNSFKWNCQKFYTTNKCCRI